jgi:4-amino-4-deoxy-L-arabinose transferase-like glycosyltransferase
MPSTFAALGILALTAWIASTLFGRALALPTVLILASSFLFFALARFLTPDMLMAFFIVAAIACLVKAGFDAGSSGLWRWGFFLAMGLGFLTKGPMALVIPISVALALQYGSGREGIGISVPWKRGLVLTLALGLSWFVVMVQIYPRLWDYFLGYELIKRFGSNAHGRSQPFWYFIPVFMVGFLPWVLFVPVMARRLWIRLGNRVPLSSAQWILVGWTVPPFLILSLSGSKLLTYLLPLFPAFALAVAYGWFYQKYSFRTLSMTSATSITILLLVFSRAEQWNNYFGRQASIRPLVQHIQRLSQDPAPIVFASGVRTHGLEFYLGELVLVTRPDADLVLDVLPDQQKRLFESNGEFEKDMAGKPNTYGIARYKDFVKYFQSSGWGVLEQAGDFVLITPVAPQ